MRKLEEVAVAFESDWTGWSIVIVGVICVAAVAWVLVSVPVLGVISEVRSEALSVTGYIVWGLLSLAALVVLLVMPGTIMRHLPEHGTVWWVVAGAIAVGIILCFWAGSLQGLGSYGAVRWIPWVPVVVIGVGTLLGAILDAVTRAAASVPMTVGGFVLLCGVVGGGLFLAARDR